MRIQPYRVLMLEKEAGDYYLIRDLLNQIETTSFILEWVTTETAAWNAIATQSYNAYLLKWQPGDRQWFADWINHTQPAPTLVLVDHQSSGLLALEMGAANYLEKHHLSVTLLEHSLRLTLALARTQAALVETENHVQTLTQQLHQQQTLNSLSSATISWEDYQATENALRESEERFRTSVENMLDCFGIYSAVRNESGEIIDFLIEYVNAATCENNHFSKEEQIGQHLCQLLPGHRQTGLFDEYCEVVKTGQPLVKESIFYEDVFGKQLLQKAFDIRAVKLGDGFAVAWRDITDTKKAIAALQESQEQLAAIAANIPGCVYRIVLHIQGSCSIPFVSAGALELVGLSPEEIIDNPAKVLSIVYPDDREQIQGLVKRSETLVSSFKREYRIIHPSGQIKWVQTMARSHYLENGDIVWDCVSLDISSQKFIEQALWESEARLSSLNSDVLDTSAVGILILDDQFQVIWINEALERFFDLERQDAVGRNERELIRDRIQGILAEPDVFVTKVLATYDNNTYSEKFECHILPSATRSERWLEHWSQPIRSGLYAGGRIEHYTDITERKLSEAALRESEERFRAIFEQAAVGIVQISITGQFLRVNQRFCEILGYTNPELATKNFFEIDHPEERNASEEALNQLLDGTLKNCSLEKRYLGKENQICWVNIALSLVRNLRNKPLYFVGVIENIQERKEAEEKLRYRLALETALAEVSTELATKAAVDFNQVLGILAQAVEANHAYIARLNPDQEMRIRYEWSQDSSLSLITKFESIMLDQSSWWGNHFQNHEILLISNIAHLPATAIAEKIFLEKFNICSMLVVPIYTHSGELWGIIGFDNIGENFKEWSDEDAQLLRVVGAMIYSYCDRQEAQLQLQASEALYASIFNHSAESIFTLNIFKNPNSDGFQLIFETINPTYEKATGIPANTIIGKSPLEVIPAVNAKKLSEYGHICLKNGQAICYEETIKFQGNYRIWRTILVPIQDSAGLVTKLQGSARDITEEKQAIAEQLRQSRYQNLLTSVTLKIRQSLQIEVILQTTVTEVQKTLSADRVLFFRFFSNTSGKVVSEAVVEGFPPMLNHVIIDECYQEKCLGNHQQGQISSCSDVQKNSYNPCYLDFLQTYHIRANLVVPILVKEVEKNSNSDTTSISASEKFYPESGNLETSNRLWGLLCVHQCAEPREWTLLEMNLMQQLADQLSIALYQAELLETETRHREELARSNAELEQFAYVASHDLQAPLQSISSYAKLLERRYKNQLDEKADKFIHYIVDGSVRMQTLINDLLQYSRVGTKVKTFTKTDCNLVLAEAITNLEITIRKNQAKITHAQLPIVIADSSQLVQLFQNLISNGIKYRHSQPPVIHISVTRQKSAWLFAVRDNGIGIDPKHAGRIFQIFQRLHTQEEYPGTGIGLAICQKIVQRHGGSIWVDSQPDQGATFFFTLPL